MAGKLVFGLVVGLGVGYVLGSRAGRARYNQIKARANEVWNDPHVQRAVHDAEDFVRETAPVVGDKIADVARAATDKVTGKTD
jgi:hypothetical protein